MTPSNTNNIKSKCFIYLRRSQDREDRQSLSIEKQDRRVKEIVQENGLMPIYMPAEEMSARKLGRPIFGDMVERIKKHDARYIAVWHLSRLSRNPVDGGMIVHLLDLGDLLGIYTPNRVYKNTPDDKAFLQIELAFSKKENDELSERVKDSFVDKRSHGQYPGPAPIGYINAIIRPGERNVIPDPEQAPKVIDCFRLAGTGAYSLDDVWKHAISIGLKSRYGNAISKSTIEDMLKRRMYTGVFRYGGDDWHKGSYEVLIPTELYDKVQVLMGWVNAKTIDSISTTRGRYYPYKSLLLCKTCKFNITAYTKPKTLASGQPAEYVFYTCTKKNKNLKCNEPQLSSILVEHEIKSRMKDYEITEEDGVVCNKWLERYYDDYLKKKNQYKPEWLRDRKIAKEALDTLDEKLEKHVISDERYLERAAKHAAVLARTKELLDGTSTDAVRWLELAKETFASITNIGDVFEVANDEERRHLMMYLGSNWYLGNKKVALTPREPLNLLHKSNRYPDWRAVTFQVWNYFVSSNFEEPQYPLSVGKHLQKSAKTL